MHPYKPFRMLYAWARFGHQSDMRYYSGTWSSLEGQMQYAAMLLPH